MRKRESNPKPFVYAAPRLLAYDGRSVRSELQGRLLVSGYVLAALCVGLLSLPFPRTTQDSPTATYIAQVILEGGAPYRDAFDVRSPGTFLISALRVGLFGASALAMRLFDFAWQLLTAWLLGRIASRFARGESAKGLGACGFVAGALYLMVYYAQEVGAWTQPEPTMNLFLLASVHFALRAQQKGRLLDWAIAGCFVGMAALTKIPFGILGAGYLALAFPAPFSWRALLSRYAALASGLLFPIGLFIAYLYSKDALHHAYYSQFVVASAYSAHYRATVPPGTISGALARVKTFPLYVIFAAALAGFRRAAPPLARFHLFFWFWFAAAVVETITHGSYSSQHMLALAPPLLILAAPLANMWQEERGVLSLRNAALLALLLAATYPTAQWVRHSRRTVTTYVQNWHDRDLWSEVGRYIRARTLPTEKIYTWGGITSIYVHSERKAACFVIPSLFFRFSSPDFNLREDCIRQIRENAPPYIVVGKDRATGPGLLIVDSSMETFPELESYFRENYVLDKEFRACWVYRRKDRPPVP